MILLGDAYDRLYADRVRVLDIEVHVVYLIDEAVLHFNEQQLRHKHHDRCKYGTLDISRAADKTDYCRGPESRRGGKTLDALALGDDYRARAYEADTGYDLRAETRDVGKHVHGQKQILAGQRRH